MSTVDKKHGQDAEIEDGIEVSIEKITKTVTHVFEYTVSGAPSMTKKYGDTPFMPQTVRVTLHGGQPHCLEVRGQRILKGGLGVPMSETWYADKDGRFSQVFGSPPSWLIGIVVKAALKVKQEGQRG